VMKVLKAAKLPTGLATIFLGYACSACSIFCFLTGTFRSESGQFLMSQIRLGS
ncbi:hypothetical protein H0H87_002259, partial [Tephrocybe sp. NHM501043]